MFDESKHHHRHKLTDRSKKSVRYPTFFPGDDISGRFELIKPSGTFDYSSITIELVGLIDYYLENKNKVQFLSLSKDISKNGSLAKEITLYNFNFKKVKLPYESYKGDSVGVKYVIRVNIVKMMRKISYEEEFAVVRPYEESILKKDDEAISMNVGIKDLLSILIEFEHINYSIHGTLKGFVSFGKVNLLLTKMEVQLLKKETIFGGTATNKAKPKVVATFELIDGGPYKNEIIPFRFFLEPYNLTPSYTDVSGNFSVRYYLNLIIKDQNNNRYFKQKEIFLFRLYLKNNKNLYNTLNNNNVNNAEQLRDFITEPIDYGDYFSVFNDIDDESDNSKEKSSKDFEPEDFYFKSSLTGFSNNKNKSEEEDYEERDEILNNKNLKNSRSNTTFDIRRNLPIINDIIINNNIINDNNISNKEILNDLNNNESSNSSNNKSDKKKKKKSNSPSEKSNNKKSNSASEKKDKKNKPKTQVINIIEKNKYKNNDILINDNYYNTDNYVIYENSYHNVFDDKLKKSRIKYSNLSEKTKIDDDEDEKNKIITDPFNDNNDDNNKNTEKNKNSSTVNSINDYNLYYPNEPFSNTLIMSNYPSNYNNIGQSGDFRQNLMGSRIKKK